MAQDYNGNTLTKVVGSNTTSYSWDFENRMSSVTLPGSGGTVTFKYDPFGRRIYKSSTAGTSVYVYDGPNVAEEVDQSGNVVARYVQDSGVDQIRAELRAGTTSYYEADGLGTVTSLSNAAGALAQTYTFDSFGKQTNMSGSLTNPFRYTARESDTETGLCYYRARYYDPSSGRFLREDPIRFKGGINFYRYAGNDATSATDPFGLYQLVGFPPYRAVELMGAIDQLRQKLNGHDCCFDQADVPRLLSLLDRATFVYNTHLSHPNDPL